MGNDRYQAGSQDRYQAGSQDRFQAGSQGTTLRSSRVHGAGGTGANASKFNKDGNSKENLSGKEKIHKPGKFLLSRNGT